MSESNVTIGQMIRHARKLRRDADELSGRADERIGSLTTVNVLPSLSGHPLWVQPVVVSPDSLGPEYNRAMTGHLTFPPSLTLGEMIESCKCGDPIRSDQRAAGPYPYYGASGPIDMHDEFNFDGEYMIVAQDGTIGRVCVATGKFWANNHVWIVKLKPEFDAYAVSRYLDGFYPYWTGFTTGSVVPKVTSENLMKVRVPISISSADGEVNTSNGIENE